MASFDEVKLEDILHCSFATFNPDTGANKDADSLPTAVVYEEGSSTALVSTVTVTNMTTGRYRLNVTIAAADGYEAGKYYELWASATVTGTGSPVTQSAPLISFKASARVVDDLGTQTSVDAIPTTAMRGTDGANTVVPDPAGTIPTGMALETSVQSTLDRLGFTLAALAGNCADPQTAAETYSIILGANTFTIDHTGLDATGTRTTATLTKS